jgi:hypothetical protein
MTSNQLKIIGYWFDPTDLPSPYPDPATLCRPGAYKPEVRTHLVRYLQSAPTLESFRGLSWCRFKCGVEDSVMGYRLLWDGVWAWPEGLAHYVDRHDLILPEPLLDRVLSRPKIMVDVNYWLQWSRNNAVVTG